MPENSPEPLPPRERPDYDAADADVQAAKAAALGTKPDELPDPHLDDDETDSAGDPIDPVAVGQRRARLKAARAQTRQPVGVPKRPIPQPEDPNADVIAEVQVNLADAVVKMMKKGGIAQADYNTKIEMTNWEYFSELVKAYYNGRDAGYTEGYTLAKRSIFRRVRIYTGITAAVGTAIVLWAIVNIIHHIHWA